MSHHQRQHKTAGKESRKVRAETRELEELPGSDRQAGFDSNPILHLQQAIGNRAVQRLMRDTPQLGLADALIPAVAIQRAPENEPQSLVVLSLVLAQKGEVKGTSKIAGHEGKIEVFSVSVKKAGGGHTISFMKGVDDATTALHEALLKGDAVKSAEFTFLRRKDDGSLETIHTLQFEDGMISGFSISGGGDKTAESVELDFSKPEEEKR